MATTKVVFAVDYTTADGKAHKGGSTVAVDSDEARDLVYRGLVQLAPSEAPAATQLDAPTVSDDKKGGK